MNNRYFLDKKHMLVHYTYEDYLSGFNYSHITIYTNYFYKKTEKDK